MVNRIFAFIPLIGFLLISCQDSRGINVLEGMDPFETGESAVLFIEEKRALDEPFLEVGLPSSYFPCENDSWGKATPLNEMRAGGILSLSGYLEAGLSLKGDGKGTTWGDVDWYLLHVQCKGLVSWSIDGDGIYAAGWFLPASATSPQELSAVGVAKPGGTGSAGLDSPGSFFIAVRSIGNFVEPLNYRLSFSIEEPSASDAPSPSALDAMEEGLPLHISLSSALPGGRSSFLGKGVGEMDLSWHPYWNELGRIAPGGYVPFMNIAFLSRGLARELNELASTFLEVSTFWLEDGALHYNDEHGWEMTHDFLVEEGGERVLAAVASLFGKSSDGIDMDKFHRSMYALNYGLSAARTFESGPSDGWIRLSPYLLIDNGVVSWGAGLVEDDMAGAVLGLRTNAPSSAYPGDYPSEWGHGQEEKAEKVSTYMPFEAYLC